MGPASNRQRPPRRLWSPSRPPDVEPPHRVEPLHYLGQWVRERVCNGEAGDACVNNSRWAGIMANSGSSGQSVGGEAGADGPAGNPILASGCSRAGEVRFRSGPSGPETRGLDPSGRCKPLVSFFESLGGDTLDARTVRWQYYATMRPRLIAKEGTDYKWRQCRGCAAPRGGAATALWSKRTDCLSGAGT